MNKITNSANSPTSAKVLDYIEGEIIHGRLKKGDKLPTERSLAEQLEVSRSSVREAVKALESMGIIDSIQGSGNYVARSMENSVDRAVCALFALNEGTLDNILQLRIVLEAEAYRDVIKYAGDEEIEALAQAAEYDYFSPSLEYISRCDHNFHNSIMQLCRNSMIKYLYNTLYTLMDMYRDQVLIATVNRNENHTIRSGHLAIIDAIRNRDCKAAEAAIREHLSLDENYSKILKSTIQ